MFKIFLFFCPSWTSGKGRNGNVLTFLNGETTFLYFTQTLYGKFSYCTVDLELYLWKQTNT